MDEKPLLPTVEQLFQQFSELLNENARLKDEIAELRKLKSQDCRYLGLIGMGLSPDDAAAYLRITGDPVMLANVLGKMRVKLTPDGRPVLSKLRTRKNQRVEVDHE